MKMRPLLAAAFSVLLLLSLTACGGEPEEEPTSLISPLLPITVLKVSI